MLPKTPDRGSSYAAPREIRRSPSPSPSELNHARRPSVSAPAGPVARTSGRDWRAAGGGAERAGRGASGGRLAAAAGGRAAEPARGAAAAAGAGAAVAQKHPAEDAVCVCVCACARGCVSLPMPRISGSSQEPEQRHSVGGHGVGGHGLAVKPGRPWAGGQDRQRRDRRDRRDRFVCVLAVTVKPGRPIRMREVERARGGGGGGAGKVRGRVREARAACADAARSLMRQERDPPIYIYSAGRAR